MSASPPTAVPPATQPLLDVGGGVAPGTVLAGKYRVQRVLGKGGMGVVVEARHIVLDDRVALKFLLPQYATHPEASTRFLREARAAVKIKNEHVARVSDVGSLDGGEPYMVMEFLEGSDLGAVLAKAGAFPLPEAVDYAIQACEAIAEAHAQGIVHRDLKPANLFLTRHSDNTPLVKVLDFGISKMMDGGLEALTKTSVAVGSALYMSPEQMKETKNVDHRTDIYSLGITLYELLTAKRPFSADTLPQLCAEILTGTPTPLRQLRPELPDDLAATLEHAYARDRAERFSSIAELVIALAPHAPARTQSSIDRVCGMAGLPSPRAGAHAEAMWPKGATELAMPVAMPPSHASSQAQATPPVAVQTVYQGAGAVGVASSSLGLGTGAGLSATAGNALPATSGAKTFVLGALAVVMLGLVVGALVWLRSSGAASADPETTAGASAEPAPAPATPATTASAEPGRVEAPADASASTAPSPQPTARGSASAMPVAVSRPSAPAATHHTPTASPTASRTPSVFDNR